MCPKSLRFLSVLIRGARGPRCCALILALLVAGQQGFAQINHIEAAAQLLNQGQPDQAEVEARQALRDPATRPLALSMLGTIRLQAGRYEESARYLKRALALNPHLVGARTNLGNTYLLEGKAAMARQSFEEVLKLDAGNFNARLGRAKAEAALHDYERSLTTAQPILAQLRETDEGVLLLAADYGPLGKKDELRDLAGFWKTLAAPANEASLDFGDSLVRSGLSAEAEEIFEGVEKRMDGQTSPALALRLGRSFLSVGNLEHSEKAFEQALSLDSGCTPCNQALAQIAEKQGNTEKALAHLLKAKQQKPDDPEILFDFGKVCLQRNLLDDALPALQKVVSLKPERDSYVYVLGSANVAKGNLPEAASLFSGLLRKHPQDAVLSYAVGAVYFLQNKYPEAESSLKHSLQQQPGQVAASYYLGLTYSATGQEELAVSVFRDLLARYPDHAPSYVQLGSILVKQHSYEEAEKNLERAVSLDPGSVQAHYQLGVLFRRLGRNTDSEREFAKSRELEGERSAQTDLRLRLLLPD